MRLAMFTQDGDTQIVFTPESAWEKAVLLKIADGDFSLYRGSFYDCNGGWIRMADGMANKGMHDPRRWEDKAKEDSSLIFRSKKKAEPVEQEAKP